MQYRTFRKVKGKETVQTDQYYISIGDFFAEEFLKLTIHLSKVRAGYTVRGYERIPYDL
jgi:hypothetical protein